MSFLIRSLLKVPTHVGVAINFPSFSFLLLFVYLNTPRLFLFLTWIPLEFKIVYSFLSLLNEFIAKLYSLFTSTSTTLMIKVNQLLTAQNFEAACNKTCFYLFVNKLPLILDTLI